MCGLASKTSHEKQQPFSGTVGYIPDLKAREILTLYCDDTAFRANIFLSTISPPAHNILYT